MLHSTLPYRTLWVGSAGLIEMLYDYLFSPFEITKTESKSLPQEGQTLLVSGSASGRTATQIEHLKQDCDIETLSINMTEITTNPACISEYIRTLEYMLSQRRDVLLTVDKVPEHPQEDISYVIVHTLAAITAQGVGSGHVSNLVLTGGDTAKAIVSKLGVKGITLVKEVEDGIPLGTLIGETTCTIITKAGAYGNERSLVHAYNHVKSRDTK